MGALLLCFLFLFGLLVSVAWISGTLYDSKESLSMLRAELLVAT